MKQDDRDGLNFRPLKRLFHQTAGDPGETIVDLGQQFDFLGAQSRRTSLAPQQLTEGSDESGKGQ